MQSKITKQGNFERIVEVEVPTDELSPHFDNAFRKYQKGLKLEGFRKGKVPLGLIKKLYGDAIKGEALDDVVQSVFREVREREQLRPVAPAKLENIKYDEEKGLKFKALVEVVPEIELKNYNGLSVEKEIYQIDSEDVADALEDVRERMAVMQPVEGEAEENHHLVVDFQEVDAAGLPIVGRKYEDRVVVLDKEHNLELTEQLLGIKVEEGRTVVLPAFDETGNKTGDERYQVKVKEIKSKLFPELDDELAKDVGDFRTLEELKEDIRTKLQKRTEANSRQALRRRLIDELLKRNAFDLPESMVSSYLDSIVENAKKQNGEKFDEEELRNNYRSSAIWNLKWEIAKDKLSKQQGISLTKDDADQFIARICAERGLMEKDVRKSIKSRDAKSRFEDDVLEEKILTYLEDNAKIKEKKVTRKDLEKARKVVV